MRKRWKNSRHLRLPNQVENPHRKEPFEVQWKQPHASKELLSAYLKHALCWFRTKLHRSLVGLSRWVYKFGSLTPECLLYARRTLKKQMRWCSRMMTLSNCLGSDPSTILWNLDVVFLTTASAPWITQRPSRLWYGSRAAHEFKPLFNHINSASWHCTGQACSVIFTLCNCYELLSGQERHI